MRRSARSLSGMKKMDGVKSEFVKFGKKSIVIR